MRPLLLATLLVLAAPVAARGATVTAMERQQESPSGAFTVSALDFTAADGEVNDVTLVALGQARRYRVVDRSAPLTAGTGCTQPAPDTVDCTLPSGAQRLVFALGDGDDAMRAGVDESLEVNAGAGADTVDTTGSADAFAAGDEGDDALTGTTLLGGEGNDRLVLRGDGITHSRTAYGDAGDDVIVGSDLSDFLVPGTGTDVVEGARGNDSLSTVLEPLEGRQDSFDGGDGHDGIDFSLLTGPLAVDLGAEGPLGQVQGAGSLVRRFEDVRGGLGDDEITGSGGANRLTGWWGDDRVHGRGGDDHLDGSDGNDRLLGGAGDDRLDGAGGADHLFGNAGADSLLGDTGPDALFGGAGNDTLAGHADRDLYDGGDGDDSISAGGDAYSDVVRCGRGRDRLAYERFDARHGCERQRVTVIAPLLGALSVSLSPQGLLISPHCSAPLTICEGNLRLRATTGGRTSALGRRPFSCDPFSGLCETEPASTYVYEVPAGVRRTLRAGRPVVLRAVARFRGPGAVAIRQRISVRASS